MTIGLMLVVGAGIAAAVLASALTERTLVLAADRDLPAGHPLTPGDLRAVELPGGIGVATIPVDDQALVIGMETRGPVPGGTVLNVGLFGEQGSAVPDGMAVVGAALEPGAAPGPALRAGDRVHVLAVAGGIGGLDGDEGGAAELVTTGSIWSVERPDGGLGGQVVVSVLVPIETETSVAQAAADARLRLALIGGG